MGPYGHAGTSGDMAGRFVSNSDPGGCSGASVMDILLCLILVLIFSILDILKYMKVYEGIWKLFKVYGGCLRYMEVIQGIWRLFNVYGG